MAYIDQSKRVDWLTPQHVFTDWVYPILGFVNLDPCGNPKSCLDADHHCFGETAGDDGMALDWHRVGAGNIFINPTYGERKPKPDPRPYVPKLPNFYPLSEWMAKCVDEWRLGATIFAVLPAATDRVWFHDLVVPTASFCLLRKRLKFRLPEMAPEDNTQPCGANTLVLWAHKAEQHELFNELLKKHGYVHAIKRKEEKDNASATTQIDDLTERGGDPFDGSPTTA
jgi:hypothetical protein